MANVEKNLSVETLRGIAILLVVVGHVIGSGPDGGMKIDFPHPLRYFYVWIDYIQMPLFTAIAGWVYALKPFSASSGFGSFVRKNYGSRSKKGEFLRFELSHNALNRKPRK